MRSAFDYMPALDGMRGIAILLVMLFHANEQFFKGCFIGVDIFFVLSGFLITVLLMKEYDNRKSISFKNFYLRRVLRIAPALFFLLIIYCGMSIVFLGKQKAISNLIDASIVISFMANWSRAFGIHPPDFLGHTWSLSIEEQFYILWPITLSVLLNNINSKKVIAVFVFLIALSSWALRIYLVYQGAPIKRIYNGLDTRADALLIGCVLGIMLSSDVFSDTVEKKLSKFLFFITPSAIVFFVFVSVCMDWKNKQMYYWIYFIIEMCASFLILDLFVNKKSMIRSILSMKWLVWIGSISYGLYLWHYPIFRLMKSLDFEFTAIFTIGTILAFMFSIFSFYTIEKPFLRLKKKLRHS
ncbi:MAG: acyltransferase [Desulfobacterales bacterium]|nr:acyltransferase [Desulfobacterales bacterium]